MRKLIIDLGNTLQKLAVFEQKKLLLKDVSPGPDPKALTEFINDNGPFHAIILSSVINHPAEFEQILKRSGQLVILSERTALPLINQYLTPETLGNDRIAAAAGSMALYPGRNVLSIDAGTCITFDFLTTGGEYLGGAISPGIRMRLMAMHTFTGKLPFIEPGDFDHLTGRTTAESMLSGVINGITEEIRGVTERYRQHYGDVVALLTGGDTDFLHSKLKIDIFAVPDLVLLGLNEILDKNVDEI